MVVLPIRGTLGIKALMKELEASILGAGIERRNVKGNYGVLKKQRAGESGAQRKKEVESVKGMNKRKYLMHRQRASAVKHVIGLH